MCQMRVNIVFLQSIQEVSDIFKTLRVSSDIRKISREDSDIIPINFGNHKQLLLTGRRKGYRLSSSQKKMQLLGPIKTSTFYRNPTV